MSPGLETEQMFNTKGRRHIDPPKLGNSLANWPSVHQCDFWPLKVLQQCLHTEWDDDEM